MEATEWTALILAVIIGNSIAWVYLSDPLRRNKHLKAKIPKKKGPE